MSENITPNPSVPSQIVQELKFPKYINNLGIIPTSYKDSMSYYECLAWLCKYLEETVIPTLNQNGEAVEELQNLYVELNQYVTNYFDTLDVQEEINNKLDDMVEQGTLQEIIAEYLNSKAIFGFNTVADMKEATNLIDGSYAQTLGYYSINDNGSALYLISENEPNTYYETLESGLYAQLIDINNMVTPEMFGAYGDNETDDTNAIKEMFKFNSIHYLFTKNYIISEELNISSIPNNSIINGNGTIYRTPSANGVRGNLFSIVNRTNLININNLILKSTANQSPYVPSDHTARENSVSSNIIGINIVHSSNINVSNIEFNSMGYDFHIQGGAQYSDGITTFGCNNISINNIKSENGQMGIYADHTTNLYVDNYYQKCAPISVGGYHMIYVAHGIGIARLKNLTYKGNQYSDDALDLASFVNTASSDYFNADIIIENFEITCGRLVAINRKCKNITLKNGIFHMINYINESNTPASAYVTSLTWGTDNNSNTVFPVINMENINLINETNNDDCYFGSSASDHFGLIKLDNSLIDNIRVQTYNAKPRYQIECNNCIIKDTHNQGIYRTGTNQQYTETLPSAYCSYNDSNFINGNQYLFGNRYYEDFEISLSNNKFSFTGKQSIVYNGNASTTGDIIFYKNDVFIPNDSTAKLLDGITNTTVIQYLNYLNGNLWTTS